MKRIALVVAVVALAACTKKDDAAMMDTGAAMAPAPAMGDTGMRMMDSSMMMKDSMMMRDSGMRR